MPNITVDSNGEHTHARGSMNITGTVAIPLWEKRELSGAFYIKQDRTTHDYGSNMGGYTAGFDASRTWTGRTTANGNHTHVLTCNLLGKSSTVQPPAICIRVKTRYK